MTKFLPLLRKSADEQGSTVTSSRLFFVSALTASAVGSGLISAPAHADCQRNGAQVECTGVDGNGFASSDSLTLNIVAGALVSNRISPEVLGNCPLSFPAIELGPRSTVINNGAVSTGGVCGFGIAVGASSNVTNAGRIFTGDIVAFGIVTSSGTSIRTRGTIETLGQSSSGIFGIDGIDVVAERGGQIVTFGIGARGIEVLGASRITNDGTIATMGDSSSAIETGEGSIVVNRGRIQTSANNAMGVRIIGSGAFTNEGVVQTLLTGPALALVPTTGVYMAGRNAAFSNTVGATITAHHIGVQIDAGQELSFTNHGRIEVAPAVRANGVPALGGGAIVFSGPSGGAFLNSGIIEGAGGLPALRATGPLVLVNTGTIRGDVLLGAGPDTITLRSNSVIDGILDAGAGNDALYLADSGNLGEVRNIEFLAKSGAGAWTLTRPIAVAGEATVISGALVLAPEVTLSATQMNIFGMLRGFGRVDAAVENSGTITPGADGAFGTLNFARGFRQLESGTLALRLSPHGSHDQVMIKGQAQFGGTLTISYILTPDSPTFASGQRFEIIAADGPLNPTGEFTVAAPGLVFVKPHVVKTAEGGLAIEIERLSYGVVGRTAAQRSVGVLFDSLQPDRPAALRPLFDALEFGTEASAAALLSDLAADGPGAAHTLGAMTLDRALRVVMNPSQASAAGGTLAWAQGFTAAGRTRAIASPSDYAVEGLAAGLETHAGSRRLGVVAARTEATASFDAVSARTRQQISVFGVTAQTIWSDATFNAALLYGQAAPSARRTRTFNGMTETLAAHADSTLWAASLAARQTMAFGGAHLIPHAGLVFTHTHLGAMDEGRPLSLRTASSGYPSLRGRAGVSANAVAGRFRPFADLALSVEALKTGPRIDAELVDVPQSRFLLMGESRRRVALEAEAGASFALAPGVDIYVAGNITANDVLAGHTVSTGLSYRW